MRAGVSAGWTTPTFWPFRASLTASSGSNTPLQRVTVESVPSGNEPPLQRALSRLIMCTCVQAHQLAGQLQHSGQALRASLNPSSGSSIPLQRMTLESVPTAESLLPDRVHMRAGVSAGWMTPTFWPSPSAPRSTPLQAAAPHCSASPWSRCHLATRPRCKELPAVAPSGLWSRSMATSACRSWTRSLASLAATATSSDTYAGGLLLRHSQASAASGVQHKSRSQIG